MALVETPAAAAPKKPANPLISSRDKCRICGDFATIHVHYGSVSCFSCRAFFRRYVSLMNTVSAKTGKRRTARCKRNGNCDVTGKNSKQSLCCAPLGIRTYANIICAARRSIASRG